MSEAWLALLFGIGLGVLLGWMTVAFDSYLVLRLLGTLHVVRLVWLEDFQGKATLTVMRRGPRPWCHVYPGTRVGHVILNADGTTGGESVHIRRWRHYRDADWHFERVGRA